MNEILHYAWICAAGASIGALYFGGLWWTVRNAIGFAVPGLWFAGSTILRTGLALVGFWLVADGDWRSIVACLFGFLAARLVVTRMTRVFPKPTTVAVLLQEVRDAA